MTTLMSREGEQVDNVICGKKETMEVEQLDDELACLRRQNSELKSLVLRALQSSLKLEDLPLDLRDDRDSILTAVKAEAVDWYALPQKWKDDVEIACAIFERECMDLTLRQLHSLSSGLQGKPTVMWRDLPYHLKMNEEVLLHALRANMGPRWEDIPFQFRANVDLLSTAFQYGKIDFEDIPSDLQRNHREISFYAVKYNLIPADECPCLTRDFFKQVVEDGELDWDQLPIAFQHDISFAQSITCFANEELPGQILRHLAEIRNDSAFWRMVIHSSSLGDNYQKYSRFKHLLEQFAPADLLSDRDFMLEMCRECTGAFSVVGRSLASDNEFVELALEQNAAVLQFLSFETQRRHPDLVVKAILAIGESRYKERDDLTTCYVAKAICPSFWMNYDFAMNWMKAGHRFPTELSHEAFSALVSDRGLCLASAIHGQSMHYVGPQFTSDISFMSEVLEHHPALYSHATGSAEADPVVMTKAFASLPDLVANKMMELHFQGKDNEIQQYLSFLRIKLNLFKAFKACILGNMLSTQSVEATGTNLTLLNQGIETSAAYKKLLAEYLGIPTGKWLRRLLQAERNVCEAIAPWAPNAYV